MQPLDYTNVISLLFRALPEAKAAYEDWGMLGQPLPYIVFSFLEESFLTPVARSGTNDELRERIFGYLEQMAASNDSVVTDLLAIGLFEAWSENGIIMACFSQMGPRTKVIARKAVKAMKPRSVLDRNARSS